MKKVFDDYRYLAGGTGTSGSLWEGPDHLLFIQASGFLFAYTETYKRIDYAKIQTISVGRSRTFGWTAVLLSLLLLATIALLYHAITAQWTLLVIPSVIVALFLAMLVAHLARGPTCKVKLQTAVQVVNLSPLKRMRAAARTIERLTELCRAHQGSEAVAVEALHQGLPPASAFQQRGVKPPMPRSKLLMAAIPMLILAGVILMGEPFITHLAYTIADISLCVAGHLAMIIALATLSRYEMPGSLRFSMWGAAANFLLIAIFAYGLMIFGSISMTPASLHANKGLAAIESEVNAGIFFWLAKVGFDEMNGFAWLFVVLGGLSFFFGLLGLPALLRPRSDAAEAAAPPVVPTAPAVEPAPNDQPEDQP